MRFDEGNDGDLREVAGGIPRLTPIVRATTIEDVVVESLFQTSHWLASLGCLTHPWDFLVLVLSDVLVGVSGLEGSEIGSWLGRGTGRYPYIVLLYVALYEKEDVEEFDDEVGQLLQCDNKHGVR